MAGARPTTSAPKPETARGYDTVGYGSKPCPLPGLASPLVLADLADPTTGQLRRKVAPRELPAIIKSALDCLAWAHGSSPEGSDPSTAVERVLHQAPEDVRVAVLRDMRASQQWAEQNRGWH